jgi:trimeric autotransporter adhesin
MLVLRMSRGGLRSAIAVTGRILHATPVRRSVLSLLSLSVGVAACKEAADPVKAAAIVGLPAVDSVRLGRTVGFTIELRDASGNKVNGRKVNWSSLNPNVIAVDANGVATGLVIGATVITARADGATAQTNMSVQPLVSSVVLFPSAASLAIGSTRALTVAVSDKDGLALSGRLMAFSSSNPSVATVNGSGVVVGVSQGRAIISGQAVQDQITGTSTIDVVQVPVTNVAISPAGSQTVSQGLTLQLSAVLRDGTGTILTGRTVSWTTSNSSIATVSSSGLVTGVSLGTAQITCESEGVISSVSVTVQPRPVATVVLGPNPGGVKVGQQLQMSLDLRDANGNQLTTVGRTLLWDSSNKPVATVQDGVVAGVSPGSATITVTVDGKPASAVVTVTP